MRKVLSGLVFLVLVAVAAPASAQFPGFGGNISIGPGGVKTLSSSAEAGVNEIKKIQGEVKLDQSPFAQDETMSSAKKKWDTVTRQFENAQRAYQRIPSNEGWHPDVKKAKEFVDAFGGKYNNWKGQWEELEKKFEGEKKLRKQFDEFVRDFSNSLNLLARVEKDVKKSVSNVDDALKAWNDADNLAKVVEVCKDKYASLKNWGDEDTNGPETTCKRAGSAKDLLKPYMKATAEAHVATLVDRTKKATAAYAKDGWIDADLWTELGAADQMVNDQKRRVEPLYKAAGEAQPENLFNDLAGAAKDFFAEVDAGAKKYALPKAAANDATVNKVLNASFGKYDPRGRNVQVLAIRVQDLSWNIVKNEFSLPLRREKAADILLKVPGEKYCRQVEAWVAQDYSGAGTYQEPGNAGWGGRVRLLNCK